MNANNSNSYYEVLSPWADAAPITLRGISSRLTNLTGKKIGLFGNPKQASKPILTMVENKLKEMFPTSEFSWYVAQKFNTPEIETEGKERFEEWIKGVDAVIAAVGD